MTVSLDRLAELHSKAAELRWHIITMMGPNKAHHFGGSLSAADIVTALYFYKMRYDPHDPDWPERDRFLMSKGHSVPAQYAALAMLGVCIPLCAVLKSASIPFLVIGGAVLATFYIWNSGQRSQEKSEEEEVEILRRKVADLEERLANVEVINSFEERLAARELDHTEEEEAEAERDEVEESLR